MGASTREKGVVKLVHPGRHVEIHRQPITAAEVMRKNPRHCITRPDVFEYPWIVVRPESVLVPGKVFYIVPNRTIHHLLKARGQPNQLSPPQNHYAPKCASPFKSWAGMTPKHQPVGPCLEKKFQNMHLHDFPTIVSQLEQDSDESCIKASQVRSWPEVTFESKYIHQEPDKKSPVDSSVNIGSYQSDFSSEQNVKLKSCLWKQDSVRKSRNLKVTFALPTMMPSLG